MISYEPEAGVTPKSWREFHVNSLLRPNGGYYRKNVYVRVNNGLLRVRNSDGRMPNSIFMLEKESLARMIHFTECVPVSGTVTMTFGEDK